MKTENKFPTEKGLVKAIGNLLGLVSFLLITLVVMAYFLIFGFPKFSNGLLPHQEGEQVVAQQSEGNKETVKNGWAPPDTSAIAKDETGKQILYGRSLIVNTSRYLGPKGTVAHISNGMNCQNCHLDAGTKAYGNNYSGVASTYPKLKQRSGKIESVFMRVNDCFQRSLNGEALDTNSKEMKAIRAYIDWLGKDVKKGVRPEGAGVEDLAFSDRAADPEKGKVLFMAKCIACHGAEGKGVMLADGTAYQYPPLWGEHSFNTGAGLFRISRFAGYIKNNMPQGATHSAPQLTDQEAWDIAAFVNSQSRPKGNISKDWPDISQKPVDHPFGPYADTFSETQHKFGPFAAINALKKQAKNKSGKNKATEVNQTK
jgi:thiosulfate dehydrogenase